MSSAPAVAIVGWAGVFPRAATTEAFWEQVRAGQDAASLPPPGRWCVPPEAVLASNPDAVGLDQVRSAHACFVTDPPPQVPEGLVGDMAWLEREDPFIGWMVEVSRRAYRSGGAHDLDPARVGVVLGHILLPNQASLALAAHGAGLRTDHAHRWARWSSGRVAGCVARALGLGGPHRILDAACASTFYALDQGVRALQRGDADAMLVGGGSRADSLYTQVGFSQLQALSRSGCCRPFDQRADGLIVGEGGAVFMLRRLADARRDDQPIFAVLRGIGLSNDIEGGLLAPSEEGQVRAIEAAFREASWSPGVVDYIECHATGTPKGDATEVRSLHHVWRRSVSPRDRCPLGAVKANVGHWLTGAGAAALAKVLLSFHHREIPPVANFERPAAQLELELRAFDVPTHARPWVTRGPARAALSGFGFGGTNAHVLMEAGEGQEASRVQITVPAPNHEEDAALRDDVVIVGWSARVGSLRDEAVTDALLAGRYPSGAVPTIDTLVVSPSAFRIPPRALQGARPQQVLALLLAARALEGVVLPADQARRGVFLGAGLDPAIADFHVRWRGKAPASPGLDADRTLGGLASVAASRIARTFACGGPSFTLSSEETSGLTALALAWEALRAGTLDLAIVGGLEFAADPRVEAAEGPLRSPSSPPLADGGAVLALKRRADAVRDGDPIIAQIQATAEATGGLPQERGAPSGTQEDLLRGVLTRAGWTPEEVEFGVCTGPATDHARAQMQRACARVFGPGRPTLAAPACVGDCGHGAGLVALLAAMAAVGQHDAGPSRALVLGVSTSGAVATALVSRVPRHHTTGRSHRQTNDARDGIVLSMRPRVAPTGGAPARVDVPPVPPEVSSVAAPVGPARPAQPGDREPCETLLQLASDTGRAHHAYLQLSRVRLDLLTRVAAGPLAPPWLDRDGCFTFAIGRIGDVLGPDFAAVDAFPTRVRLPDAPLMLVDRILAIEGQPRSMQAGRVITEHDVLGGAWYLDGGCVPTCIAVEAGQADLLLSAYLGVDEQTRGLAVYRLLDAAITFHDPLPPAGSTIRYDIRIERFFRQGETWLFRFAFEATVTPPGGPPRPLLSMRDGCAGFFTPDQLAAGQGVVPSPVPPTSRASTIDGRTEWRSPEARPLDATQLAALRAGDLEAAFGTAYCRLALTRPLTLPSGSMALLDRVILMDPRGGPWGAGHIVGEYDLDPEDWFLRCHFIDDPVMPGTLMYECCLHTLRVLLLAWGWIGEDGEVAFEPVPGVRSRLECRGQVLPSTRVVGYEVSIRERGFEAQSGAPYVIADALMTADGRPIVRMSDMSLRLRGATREALDRLHDAGKVAMDREGILAFAEGAPSKAFGPRYGMFDEARRIARLPRPPFMLIDAITRVEGKPFVMEAGARAWADVDLEPHAWMFEAARQQAIPFAMLLEIALQPCGWLAAYVGSPLHAEHDLRFRNLGGEATLLAPVGGRDRRISTAVRLDRVSHSGGMIIQHYTFACSTPARGLVYEGTTYFGYFSDAALADQVGLRDASPLGSPPPPCPALPRLPTTPPFPDARWKMIDAIEGMSFDDGPHGLGRVRGSIRVDPSFWFFEAHFYQDPVWPGSLGLQALLQLLQAWMHRRFELDPQTRWMTTTSGSAHHWVYRGQVLPTDGTVVVDAIITHVDPRARRVLADATLWVDGRPIYAMRSFGMEVESP